MLVPTYNFFSNSSIRLLLYAYFIGILSINLSAQKINGMSFIGPKDPVLKLEMVERLKITNANWIALIPEATVNRTTLRLEEDSLNNWWGETIAANRVAIKLAKEVGLKVFLKPHVVLGKIPDKKKDQTVSIAYRTTTKFFKNQDKTRGTEWRGSFSAKNEKDWRTFEQSYEKYIIELAIVAEELNVELFSLGTELKQFAVKRPAFWKQLIQKVRKVYSGQLTYAANWDEYKKITFWKDLDYIGIDTYFPINRMKTPDVKTTLKNWKSIKRQLRKFSKETGKKILLTEFGYRNIAYAGKRPWLHDKGVDIRNDQAQVNLYRAFFQTFWNKSWVAGGFAWKWFATPEGESSTSFSLQNKPALSILQSWYAEE